MKTIFVDANDGIAVNGKLNIPMFEMLEKFPNKKIILTNAADEQMAKYGLDDMPYEVFSLKHNPNKEDPNYYKSMLSHYGLVVSDAVYFDHIQEAVASAQSVGIKSYYFDCEKNDLEALRLFLQESI